jgi:hypothetical protein
MFLSCALLLGYCHYMYKAVHMQRERERGGVWGACLFLLVYYGLFRAVDFPQIRF